MRDRPDGAPPLVSVIIPARNAEKTVGNAVVSVLEQTMPDLELIVVDDASTDGTASVVAGICDPRVRLLRSELNIREAAARNMGVRSARGKWVAFLDADDEWVGGRIENMLCAAGEGAECFVGDRCAVSVPGPDGRLVPVRAPDMPAGSAIQDLDLSSYLALRQDVKPLVPRALMVRYRIEFPEWGSGGEWVFLIARLSASGVRGKLVHRVGYLWRGSGTHDSSTVHAKEEMLRVLEFLASDSSLPEGSRELLRRKTEYTREGLLAAALRQGNVGKFLRHARHDPLALLGLPRRALLYALTKIRIMVAREAIPIEQTEGVDTRSGLCRDRR